MASAGCSAFSQDGEYFAYCGNDGKLKIWETASGRLKHEYVPNLHLSSPCSVVGWISVSYQSTTTSPSPWKKRRKKQVSEEPMQKGIVAMGSVDGKITLYDTASASVTTQLENGHTGGITALTWSANSGFFTVANDYQIVEWNLQENGIKCKWKSGKAKVTALAILMDGKSIISAERTIKWWDLATKNLVRTFTGHANQVTCLHPLKISNTTSYLISGACGDTGLSVWALNDNKNDRTSVATLALQDEPMSISVHIAEDSEVMVISTTRSGQAHLFKYQPNGRTKPVKPSLTIAVASDLSQKEGIQQIPILISKLTEDQKLLLAYGSFVNLTFEKVVPDFSDKIQCLVRSEIKKTREKKEELISKVKSTAVQDDVQYLAPGATGSTVKRNRTNSGGSQLLLKDRLENLSLNAEVNATGRTPTKGANMAQLLMQGLNSKDRTILNNVLFTKNETVIRNTIAKLPVQAITPLLKELTVMLQGKTYPSKIAVNWLHLLLTTHAGHLLSHPDIAEWFSPILSLIDAKLMLLTDVSKLRGRVSLVTGQISQTNEERNKDITEESLLVYQDPDSSDEGAGMDDADMASESDENWEEISNQEDDEEEEQNDEDVRTVKSEDDNDSIYS
ncbi:hypothetical protein KM043_011827 [Ampulex compressa]|nr:hypothetical protein KM043_011827 [Ampulex compressa]